MTRRNPRGRPPHGDVLTPAEWRVLEAVRHGLSNPQIAKRQGVSLDAVKYHVANLLLKLGLELIYAFPGMAFFRLGDVRLYLHEGDKPVADSILYFRVEDIHAAHAELERRGVQFMNAPHMLYRDADGAEDWMAEFRDNE